MNKYDKMTDGQINYLVAKKEGSLEDVFDYCNDINAAWPIMVKHGIEVVHPKDGSEVGSAYYFRDSNIRVLAHDDKNVIRAAMIVRLMIGDSDEKN